MNVACSIGLRFSSRTSINVDHSGNLIAPECHEFKAFGSCKHESLHLLIFLACLDGHNLHQLSTRDIKTILYDETSGSAGSSSSLVSGWVQTCCDQNAAVKLLGRSSAQCVQPVKLARHKIGQIVVLGWLQATNQCFSYSFGVFCICDLKERLMMLYWDGHLVFVHTLNIDLDCSRCPVCCPKRR